MIYLKHNIKTLIRSPGRSLLFSVLLALLIAILSLEAGIFLAARIYLAQADENYITIGVFHHLGDNYPDEEVLDPAFPDAASALNDLKLADHPAVVSINIPHIALGNAYSSEETRSLPPLRTAVPAKNAAVLVLSIRDRKGIYGETIALVSDTLYSHSDYTGTLVGVYDRKLKFDPGHTYIVNGEFTAGENMTLFVPGPFGSEPDYTLETIRDLDEYVNREIEEETAEAIAQDITGQDGYSSAAVSFFQDYADTYRAVNTSITIRETRQLEAEIHFHQEDLQIIRGRPFLPEEYDSGSRSVIIPDEMAVRLGTDIGGTIRLKAASHPELALLASYSAAEGYAFDGDFTVVGITGTVLQHQHAVYIPAGSGLNLQEHHYGSTLATAVLRNDQAADWYQQIQDSLPPNIRLTLYDHGYEQMSQPLRQVADSALLLLTGGILAGLLVLALYGYFLVYRSRGEVRIQTRLGSGQAAGIRFLLWPPLLLAIPAMPAGQWLGRSFADEAAGLAASFAETETAANLSYSSSRLSVTRGLPLRLQIPEEVFGLTAAAVVLAALLFSLFFAWQAVRVSHPGHRTVSLPGTISAARSRTLVGAGPRYAWLSTVRGGLRSLLAFLFPLAATAMLLQLSSSHDLYSRNRDQYAENTPVEGYFTTLKGDLQDGLIVSDYSIRRIGNSQFVEAVTATSSHPYLLQGIMKKDRDTPEMLLAEIYENPLLHKLFKDRSRQFPRVIYTNRLAGAPQFSVSSISAVRYMKGWDESFFSEEKPADKAAACLVTKEFMKQYGLDYGDHIYTTYGESLYGRQVLKIVGSYPRQGSRDHIYAQMAGFISPSALSDEDFKLVDSNGHEQLVNFRSTSFRLKPSADLEAFRNFLEDSGYSQVRRIGMVREFIIIEDLHYLLTLRSMDQHLRYTGMLYPAIYGLTILLAAVIPWMLMTVRRRELVIMRRAGTPRLDRFLSFYTEYAGFGIAGIAAGSLLYKIIDLGSFFSSPALPLIVVFLGTWLISSALTVAAADRNS